MKNSKAGKDHGDDALLAALRSCGPVACMAGTGHPAWIFVYRVDGRRKCLYVRKRDVPAVRAALERGRRVEALLLEEGVRLIESLRAEADAD